MSASGKSRTAWGARIESLLDGRTLVWLAEQTGIDKRTIGDILSKSMPGADKAVRIAQALGCSVEYLLSGEGAFPGASVAAGAQAALREAQGRAFDPVYRPLPVPPKGEPTAYDRAALTLDAAYRRSGVEPSEALRIALMSILIRHEISADELVLLLDAIN
jgi:transcriptional regulator with XRE-family HTH domain